MKKKMKKQKKINLISGQDGQTFPVVIILAGVLAILSTALVVLFQFEEKSMVKTSCIMQKQELAGLALEQCIYTLQQGNNWGSMITTGPITNYDQYKHEFSTSIGTFTVHMLNGNLFETTLNDPTTRQGINEFKTIGIKIKSKISGCVGEYYAVVQRTNLGGPLISNGKIDTFVDTDNNGSSPDKANFFWGDIYSANSNSGYCRIRQVQVTNGASTGTHAPWMPRVYSKSDIYTAISYNNGRAGSTLIFGYTYDDMSPTAHSHPFTSNVNAPDIDFDFYRNQAKKNDTYYCASCSVTHVAGCWPYSSLTPANISAALQNDNSVLFVDTTDGLPLRVSPCNAYCLTVTASNKSTIAMYADANHQYETRGTAIIMGPLILEGDTPANGMTKNYFSTPGTTTPYDTAFNIPPPGNYYSPQATDGNHYVFNSTTPSLSNLTKVKHYGLIYTGGELHIGTTITAQSLTTNICIYGTVYLGDNSALTMDTANAATLYVYYNPNQNLFGDTGESVEVLSFNELSFLVPTPQPVYPAF